MSTHTDANSQPLIIDWTQLLPVHLWIAVRVLKYVNQQNGDLNKRLFMLRVVDVHIVVIDCV